MCTLLTGDLPVTSDHLARLMLRWNEQRVPVPMVVVPSPNTSAHDGRVKNHLNPLAELRPGVIKRINRPNKWPVDILEPLVFFPEEY